MVGISPESNQFGAYAKAVMTHLYTFRDTKIYSEDFLKALEHVGVVKGDTIFVHSDVTVFGKPVLEGSVLLPGLVSVLQTSVGESGTVILPTFTYSFTKNEEYNPRTTPSTVGSLTEFFRKQPRVKRTQHPLFSVAIWGAHAEECMHIGKDSFGPQTIFEFLRTFDAKIIFMGAPFASLTFVHHIEQMHMVPYRYLKEFSGTLVAGKPYQDTFTFFVRPLDGTIETDLTRLESELRNRSFMKEVTLGRGSILSVRARDVYDTGMQLLDADPYALIEKHT